jgi:hypothetical protein
VIPFLGILSYQKKTNSWCIVMVEQLISRFLRMKVFTPDSLLQMAKNEFVMNSALDI